MNDKKHFKCPYKGCKESHHYGDGINSCPETGKPLPKNMFENIAVYFYQRIWLRPKTISYIIGIFFSLYSLFCGIYSDIIVQNDYYCVLWPFHFLRSNNSTDIETFVKDGFRKRDNTYVFVVDISGSVFNSDQNLLDNLTERYTYLFNQINSQVGNILKLRDNLSLVDISKLEVCNSLKYLQKVQKANFSIWVLGQKAYKIYPEIQKYCKADETNINSAIKYLWKLPLEKTQSTDFLSLFNTLQIVYHDELREPIISEYDNPFFVLTLFSDMMHDIDNKYTRQKEIDENWQMLIQEIQAVSSAKIMINMIILSAKQPIEQRTVFSIFQKNMVDWYRLRKYLISSKLNDEILYTVCTSKKQIRFYYTNPHRISAASTFIRSKKRRLIKLDIPTSINFPTSKFGLYCERVGANNKLRGANGGKRLISGGNNFEVTLESDQKLKLTYSGRLPSNFVNPMVRMSSKDEKTIYLIHVDFIKRLPWWSARLMSFMFLIMLISPITLIVSLSCSRCYKKMKIRLE